MMLPRPVGRQLPLALMPVLRSWHAEKGAWLGFTMWGGCRIPPALGKETKQQP